MKELMIMCGVIALILVVMLWPNKEVYSYIDHETKPLETFEIVIDGAVHKPDTYSFYGPITLQDILTYFVYPTSDADLSLVYMDKIYDGDASIYIPSLDDEGIEVFEKVNVNKASFQDLLEVPGMQERQAAAIILYREANGLYASLDELINCTYIGAASLENLRVYLEV